MACNIATHTHKPFFHSRQNRHLPRVQRPQMTFVTLSYRTNPVSCKIKSNQIKNLFPTSPSSPFPLSHDLFLALPEKQQNRKRSLRTKIPLPAFLIARWLTGRDEYISRLCVHCCPYETAQLHWMNERIIKSLGQVRRGGPCALQSVMFATSYVIEENLRASLFFLSFFLSFPLSPSLFQAFVPSGKDVVRKRRRLSKIRYSILQPLPQKQTLGTPFARRDGDVWLLGGETRQGERDIYIHMSFKASPPQKGFEKGKAN